MHGEESDRDWKGNDPSGTAIRTGHLLTRHKRVDGVLLLGYNAARLQLVMYPLIDLRA